MLTGEIRGQVDRIWDAFWSGGISNPLEVIEQITYLLFLRRLDDLQILEENKAARSKKTPERRIFPTGKDNRGRAYEDLRWSRFKNVSPAEMYTIVNEHVFPFLRTLGGDDSTYAHHMKDARFTIPTPALLAKVVDMIALVPMEDRDTKGDLYEYMLGKIASAGQNGQFRTPRHIIQLMVEMMRPSPADLICDPACGTAGFLVAAGEYINNHAHVLRAKPGMSLEFLCRVLENYDVSPFVTGTTRGKLTQAGAAEILVPVPPLSGQRRIAEILDRADALRAKRRAAIALLDTLTQSIFLNMFGDSDTNSKRWPSRPLKDWVQEIQIGPFGSLLHEHDYEFGGISLINPTHIVEGAIVPNPEQAVSSRKHRALALYHLKHGDVVMGRRGEMGRCAVVGPKHDGLLCGTGSLFIRPDVRKATALYLVTVLTSAAIRSRLDRLALGVTLPNLNRGIVEALVIAVPPLHMQTEFEHCVLEVDRLRASHRASLVSLDALFASLQHRAFRGEL